MAVSLRRSFRLYQHYPAVSGDDADCTRRLIKEHQRPTVGVLRLFLPSLSRQSFRALANCSGALEKAIQPLLRVALFVALQFKDAFATEKPSSGATT